MLLTINQVLNARNSLGELNNIKLPIATAIKLNGDMDKVNDVFSEFEKRQLAIYEKHGEAAEGPGQFKFEPDQVPVINGLLADIGIEEIDLDVTALPLSVLNGDAKLSGNDLKNLNWYLDSEN